MLTSTQGVILSPHIDVKTTVNNRRLVDHNPVSVLLPSQQYGVVVKCCVYYWVVVSVWRLINRGVHLHDTCQSCLTGICHFVSQKHTHTPTSMLYTPTEPSPTSSCSSLGARWVIIWLLFVASFSCVTKGVAELTLLLIYMWSFTIRTLS